MFDNEKKNCLAKIDKSNKQSIDEDIRPLIELINSHKDYYTTSSCSGRILLIEKKTENKQDARFKFAEHNKAEFEAIRQSLEHIPNNDIWLRQESIIIHVCCRHLEAAEKLLKTVRDIGIKRAGIININKRIMLEIIGTEAMETIIAREGNMLIEEGYLKTIVAEANKKLGRNQEKINGIYHELKIVFESKNKKIPKSRDNSAFKGLEKS